MEASLCLCNSFFFLFLKLDFSSKHRQFYSFQLKLNLKRWNNNNFQKCPQGLIWNSHKQLTTKCKNSFHINVVEPKAQLLHWNDVE